MPVVGGGNPYHGCPPKGEECCLGMHCGLLCDELVLRVMARSGEFWLELQATSYTFRRREELQFCPPSSSDRRYANSITSSSVVVRRVLHHNQLVSILAFSTFFAPPEISPTSHVAVIERRLHYQIALVHSIPTSNGPSASDPKARRQQRGAVSISWLDFELENLTCNSQSGVIAANA